MAKPKINIPLGVRFGKLEVIGPSVSNGKNMTVRCRCDCGSEIISLCFLLKRGDVKSCGCLIKEKPNFFSHGHTRGGKVSRTYRAWQSMLTRCTNPKIRDWNNYGGRGIAVCDRWNTFENFLADMGEVPEGMSIDRYPDSNGNYEPGNCRWATKREQSDNRRNSRFYEFGGELLNIAQWSEKTGIKRRTIAYRLDKLGWDIEKAITHPVQARKT